MGEGKTVRKVERVDSMLTIYYTDDSYIRVVGYDGLSVTYGQIGA